MHFPYPLKRTVHAFPALRPGRVLLKLAPLLASPLPSISSATCKQVLFENFPGTMGLSDFP